MSLNVKILLLVSFIMVLVMALIVANIHVGTDLMTGRLEREVNRMISEALGESLEDLLFRQESENQAEQLASLRRRLEDTRLLHSWIVVEPLPRTDVGKEADRKGIRYANRYMSKRLLLWDRDYAIQDFVFTDPDDFDIPVVASYAERNMSVDLIEEAVQSREPRSVDTAVAIPLFGRRLGAPDQEPDILWVLFGQTLPVEESIFDLRPKFYRTLFWVMTLGTLLLLVMIFILLNRFVQRPLDKLVDEFKRVERGEYTHELRSSGRSAEFDRLTQAFEAMREKLRGSREELEREVDDATSRARAAMRDLMLAQRMNALGVLAAGVAHEINNPLGGMINAARTIARAEGLDDKTRDYLDLIQDGLRRVEEIVQRILVFSHQREAPGDKFLVADAVTRARQLVDYRMRGQSVAFEMDVQPADLDRAGSLNDFVQVFLNLFTNSLDAMPEGGSLTVRGRRDGATDIISVTDTGKGMTEAELQSVFDLFFTTKPPGQGTGLGMAIVYNVMKNYGGRVDVTSMPGQGTTIELIFEPADA